VAPAAPVSEASDVEASDVELDNELTEDPVFDDISD